MTGLLASVIDAEELETAIRLGADIIDLKDPGAGALGALPLAQIRSLVHRVAGRRPVSATVGDLPNDPRAMREAVRLTAATGVDYVKVGFFATESLDACLRAISQLTADQAVVAVLCADRSPALHDLSPFAAAGFAGLMLDTADKHRGGLLTHLTLPHLGRFVAQARSLGLRSGLAGSLRLEDIPALLTLRPDYLGFRGALCPQGQRQRGLDAARVKRVRLAMAEAAPQRGLAHL